MKLWVWISAAALSIIFNAVLALPTDASMKPDRHTVVARNTNADSFNTVENRQLKRAYAFPYSCVKPSSAEQDNLCIARQSATAAAASAAWSARTFYAGIAGTIALLTTLIFTALAALAAQRSANAANESIKGAEKALDHARNSAERELRAYVHVKSGGLDASLAPGQHPSATMTVSNFGKTPAYEFRVRTEIRGGPLAILNDTPSVEEDMSTAAITLAPGADFEIPCRIDIATDAAVVAALQAQIFGILVSGVVTYKDSFGKPRKTTYRLLYKGSPLDPTRRKLTPDVYGNEAT